jgi:hypothetical protein
MPKRQMHLVAYLKTGPTAMHVGGSGIGTKIFLRTFLDDAAS